MRGTILESGKGYSAARPTDVYLLSRRRGKTDGRVIIATPPANNTAAAFWSPFHSRNLAGFWPEQLARDGRTVLCIDAGNATGGVNSWANDVAMGAIDDAIAFLGGRGYPVDRIGLLGWSMGGLTALNYLKRHPALVACAYLIAPATNLDYAHASIDTPGVNAAYGNNYPAAAAGHDPTLEPAAYRGLPPVHIVHAINDALVPIQQSRDFVAAVNDPNLTLEEVDTGAQAGHFAAGTKIAITDVPLFYRQHLDP